MTDARPALVSTRLGKHSITIAGHRTSISLEAAFWAALNQIALAKGLSVNRLIAEIDAARSGNLSSAIRVYVLENRALLENSEL